MILAREPGAHIAAVKTAFPAQAVGPAETALALRALFPREDAAFIDGLVERSGVRRRYIVPSIAEVLAAPAFGARNERYVAAALELAERASRSALDASGIAAGDIDVLIDVSCTGIAIPALDVLLTPRLGLRRNVRRFPITESGCAAGGLALGLASSLAQSGARVLVVAVEVCSLTMGRQGGDRASLVASVLFGDGAAAAVVAPGARGPRVSAVASELIEASEGAMGFDVGEHGLRIVLQRELPGLLVEHLPAAVERFLGDHGRASEDVGLHLVHPGGRRILDSYAQLFGLTDGDLRFSREALASYGNLSSASILSVLELALAEPAVVPAGKEALVTAIGPGLSIEFLLLDWNGGERPRS